MARKARSFEKRLFEIVREYNQKFYYSSIFKVVDDSCFKLKVEKDREEMVGFACIYFPDGDRIDYEVRFNRIVNLKEDYTLHVPGLRIG
ncbi:MAG: hypothetical protein ACOX7R_09295 [Acetivibrionales bacterium]|jgi:hypothetical protein